MISNERLEELIAGHEKAKKAARIIVPNLDTPVGDALLECLQELQRYRQAAKAGVEEAAKRIAEKISESLAGDYYATFDQNNERPIIAAELTALLAERDAKIAVLEARLAVLGKVEEMLPRQFFNLIVSPLHDGGFDVSLYNWDAEVEERGCDGKTLLEAFTALVDAPAVEAKGGE
jgi:hypothetical protein